MTRFNNIPDIYNLTGITAVVTGADGGIGLCFCRELARRKASVVMISNRHDSLHKAANDLRKEFEVDTYPLTLDLTSHYAVHELCAFIDDLGLQPKLLINNAGIFSFRTIIDTPSELSDKFIALHISSLTDLSREFAKRFIKQSDGYILNMSSMSCWMPMPGIALYSATKSYIRVFSRSLNYETRDYGVSVTVACPGGIATPLFGLPDNLMKLALRLHAVQTPEKLAEKALNKTLRRKKQYINGFINRLAIVFISVLPGSVRRIVKHKMLDNGITR